MGVGREEASQIWPLASSDLVKSGSPAASMIKTRNGITEVLINTGASESIRLRSHPSLHFREADVPNSAVLRTMKVRATLFSISSLDERQYRLELAINEWYQAQQFPKHALSGYPQQAVSDYAATFEGHLDPATADWFASQEFPTHPIICYRGDVVKGSRSSLPARQDTGESFIAQQTVWKASSEIIDA